MEKVILGKYISRDSFVHNLDPRAKLAALLSLILITILYNSLYLYCSIFLLLVLVQYYSNLSLRLLGKFLSNFRFFLYITFLVHLLFTPAQGDIEFLIFHISPEGALNGIYYSWRLLILIFCGALFSWTTQPIELTEATEKLFKPLEYFRVPVRDFSLMMMIALRFIPTFMEEARTIRLAQKARGVEFEGSIFKKVKLLVPLIIPLFVSAFRKAETLAYALEVKGYSSTSPKTSFEPLQFTNYDWLILGMAVLFIITGIALKVI